MNASALFANDPPSKHESRTACRVRSLIAMLLVMAASVPIWNVVVDPYDIFCIQLLRHSADPNERYRKVEMLLAARAHRRVHDALIIGASTAGAFRVTELERTFPGHRFYNMALRSGHLWEIEDLLKFHHQKIQPLKQVVLTVDLFQLVEPRKHGGFMTQHPAVSAQSPVEFYWSQLWASSFLGGLNKMKASLSDRSFISVAWDSGQYKYAEEPRTAAIERAWSTRSHSRQLVLRDEAITQLIRIVQWCDDSKIAITLLPTPRADGAELPMIARMATEEALRHRIIASPEAKPSDFHDATHFSSEFAARWLWSIQRER